MSKVLIVDDEENVRKIIGIQLKRLGIESEQAPDGPEALDILKTRDIQTVITDLKMPKMDGLELLGRLRKLYPQIPVIMITAHGTIDTAVEAMKKGAFDYVTKPFEQNELMSTIQRALRSAEALKTEFQRSQSFLRQEDKIIGSTEQMQKVYSVIERVANSESNILITGEAGSGKEVVVRLLHERGARKDRPLVRAFVSAVDEKEQDAYLFGSPHKQGCFDLAEDGCLYIDEISVLSLEVQAKLFDAISTGHYGAEKKKIAFRLIAASDFNLLEKIENGDFRKDLFYSLNVVPIHLPPLRDRTQDIEPLVDHLITTFSKKFSKKVSHIDEEALFQLIQYPWPGNMRELENCIEYAVNVASQPVIRKEDLPPHLFSSRLFQSKDSKGEKDILQERIMKLEKTAVDEALKSSGGDLLKASQKLGVPPSLFEKKLEELKISLSTKP